MDKEQIDALMLKIFRELEEMPPVDCTHGVIFAENINDCSVLVVIIDPLAAKVLARALVPSKIWHAALGNLGNLEPNKTKH